MSEQQSLIPNLNEIMEEYDGGEEETTLELHAVAVQEERAKTRIEIKQQQEKRRNRKRDVEES